MGREAGPVWPNRCVRERVRSRVRVPSRGAKHCAVIGAVKRRACRRRRRAFAYVTQLQQL